MLVKVDARNWIKYKLHFCLHVSSLRWRWPPTIPNLTINLLSMFQDKQKIKYDGPYYLHALNNFCHCHRNSRPTRLQIIRSALLHQFVYKFTLSLYVYAYFIIYLLHISPTSLLLSPLLFLFSPF